MGMELPGELVFVLDLLGYEWPELDEDEIRRAAVIVRQFRDDLEDTLREVDRKVDGEFKDAFSAGTTRAYADAWNDNRTQNMQQLLDLLGPAAEGIDIFADAVVALKVKVIAELTITAAQLAAAVATAFLTLGASAAANALIIAARKKALDIATDLAVEALAGQLLGMIIEPLADAVSGVIPLILEAPLVQGGAAEVAGYTADLQALETLAADLDTNGDDQERLGQEFIAQIMSLQISTAG